MDDNGVIEDMDGYMNYLSLEYDSVWDTKPSWTKQICTNPKTNPITVRFKTTDLVSAMDDYADRACSNCLKLVSFAISSSHYRCSLSDLCMVAYTDMIAERRKNVTDGVEDTFGLRNGQ
ncbi:DEAD-box ATP-dependent RNA helicase [Actinidia chinensis var. chinensis]|uniref:DEAD-box ATP-dependent RNA helicase n=1 Tax=Actinidia chinensis var. chinensis TaxID=1590841 RepID=A0A2R6P609_ACTCC|nr:DEAD-box ATP-dependent RNA helicase [Actinidia chinensis var. chinensis]